MEQHHNYIRAVAAFSHLSVYLLEWGGGRADKFSCNSAHKVYSILTDPEWQFWAQTLKVTLTSIIQVMFRELMQDSSFNLPEFAAGGMWQWWIQSAHGLFVCNEADPHSQYLQHGIFTRANIQLADEAEASKAGSWASVQLRRRAVKHITDLIHYLSQYFSQIYDRNEMLVPGLLCSKITSARAAAQRLCVLWQTHNRQDSDDSDGNDSDATTPEEEIPQPLHSVVRTLVEKYSSQVSSFARGGLNIEFISARVCTTVQPTQHLSAC